MAVTRSSPSIVRAPGSQAGEDAFRAVAEMRASALITPITGRTCRRSRPASPDTSGMACAIMWNVCPRMRSADIPCPDMALGLYDLVLAVDHEQERSWLIASGYPETSTAARAERARARIAWARERLRAAPRGARPASWSIAAKPDRAPAELKAADPPDHRLHRGRRHLSGQHHPALPRQAAAGASTASRSIVPLRIAQSGDLRGLSRFRRHRDRCPPRPSASCSCATAAGRDAARSRARVRAAPTPAEDERLARRAAREREGPRRERDDRRSAAQ